MVQKTRLSSRKGIVEKVVWIVSWLVIVVASLDFTNWGMIPKLYLGLPGWLWWDVALVGITSLVFFGLSRFAWRDE